MTKRPTTLLAASFAALALSAPSSQATLLFYDGFAAGDYSEGELSGQPYAPGAGYAAGGAWTTASDFISGGLTVPGLATTPGYHVTRDDGSASGFFDLSPGGPFGSAGLVGSNGLIGGDGVTDSLYFSVLARKEAGDASFSGIQIWDSTGGGEGFGVGEVGDGGYKWLQGGSNDFIGDPPTPIVLGETHLFVFRLDYDAANPTMATVWLDPDTSLPEGAQPAGISSMIANAGPADGFDSFQMRGARVWSFDEVRVGTTWEDVTPVPEPGATALVVLGLSGLAFSRNRRRR